MSAQTVILLTHDENATDMGNILQPTNDSSNRLLVINRLSRYVNALAGGIRKSSLALGVGAVQASGTVTLSSHVATDTVTVNGVTFTCVASGATGNQYNVGVDDTASAVNLAAAINASVTALISGYVSATSAAGVVTITAVRPGILGNCVTIAISAHGSVSAARLSGGTSGTEYTYKYGGA